MDKPKTSPKGFTNEDARRALVDGLNQDLANEYQAVIMYQTYAAMVKGPFRQELAAFFRAEIPDELGHAAYLADKIVAFGGTPTTRPSDVPMVQDPHGMLEEILKAERLAIQGYTERLQQAEKAGEIGPRVQLENQITDETNHLEEVQKMLAGWYEPAPGENRLPAGSARR